MSKWVSKRCWVVTAFYRYELYEANETPMNEEEVFLSKSKAEKCKADYEADEDIEEVCIEEDIREFWED